MSDIKKKIASLSPEKRAQLAKQLQQKAAKNAVPPPARRKGDGPPPLSYAQQRVWFLDQLEPGTTAFNLPTALRLEGPLNVPALERALTELTRRHEALRTSFRDEGGTPLQDVHPPSPFPLPVVDLSGREDREAEALRIVTHETTRPFNLATGPLLRAMLLRLEVARHVLVLTMHHIVSDGWSMGVLIRELTALYPAFVAGQPSPLPELPLQYGDFAAWQRDWLKGETLETQLQWWRQQLAGAPELELPGDFPRPRHSRHLGGHTTLSLPRDVSAAFSELCKAEGITPFMAVLAAFQVVLGRYSGQDDIVVGSPIAGRNHHEVEGLVGFFLNTLVLRTRLTGDPTVRELLGRVRQVALDAFAHQHVPFEHLQPPEGGRGQHFNVMFMMQNFGKLDLELPGLTVSGVELPEQAAKFDLTLTCVEGPDGLHGVLEYDAEVFERSTAERMLKHLHQVIATMVARPDGKLSRLELLDADEKHRLLKDWHGARAEFPDGATLGGLIREQARRAPEAVAAVVDGQQLTYAELERRANAL
ncbi:condensation domain-containing protein, partial [Pyxidicoccus sp. 3LG]